MTNDLTKLKTGDIVSNSWGYEQTNVDFYQVTRTTEKSVWFKEIESETDTDIAFDVRKVKPIKDSFKSDEIRKQKKSFMKMEYGMLKLYEKPLTETSYY